MDAMASMDVSFVVPREGCENQTTVDGTEYRTLIQMKHVALFDILSLGTNVTPFPAAPGQR